MAIGTEVTVTAHLTDTDAFRFNSAQNDKVGILARVVTYRPPFKGCRVSGFNHVQQWVSVYVELDALPEHVRKALQSALVDGVMLPGMPT